METVQKVVRNALPEPRPTEPWHEAEDGGFVVVEDATAAQVKQGQAVVACVRAPDATKCRNCGGTGFVLVRHIDGGPYRFPPGNTKQIITWIDAAHAPNGEGWYAVKTEAAPCVACQMGRAGRVQYLRALQARSGLVTAELNYRIGFLEALAERLTNVNVLEGKKQAIAEVREKINALPNLTGLLFLYGKPGTGKSGMAKSLVAAAVQVGIPAVYTTLPEYIQKRRDKIGDRTGTVVDIAPHLRSVPVLVLDEIDRVGTEWEHGELYSLADYRSRERHNVFTLMISNRTPAELQARGFGYLVSRLLQGKVIEVGGVDVRSYIA